MKKFIAVSFLGSFLTLGMSSFVSAQITPSCPFQEDTVFESCDPCEVDSSLPGCETLPDPTTLSNIVLNVPTLFGPQYNLNVDVFRIDDPNNPPNSPTINVLVNGTNIKVTFLNLTDSDGDPVDVARVGIPSHALSADYEGLTDTNPNFEYDVRDNTYTHFSYVLEDKNGGVFAGDRAVVVGNPQGSAPVILNNSINTVFGQNPTMTVIASGGQGPYQVDIKNPSFNARRGEWDRITGPDFLFTQESNQFGPSYFAATVVDANGHAHMQTLSVTILNPPVNNTLTHVQSGSVLGTSAGYGPDMLTNFDFSGFSDGPNQQFNFNSGDGAGGSSSYGFNSDTDSTPPEIVLTESPSDGECVGGFVPFAGYATDNHPTGVITVHYQVLPRIGSTYLRPLNDPPPYNPYNFIIPFGLDTTRLLDSPPTWKVEFIATDKADNSKTESVDINVDNTAPVITEIKIDGVVYPPAPTVVAGTIPIEITAEDLECAGLDYIELKINDVVVKTGPSQLVYQWITTSYSDGTHELLVTAVDTLGNSMSIGPINVLVDNTAPSVQIIKPTEGEILSQPLATVSALVSDANGISGRAVFIDNNSADFTFNSPSEYVLDDPVSTNGPHIVRVEATDSTGKNVGSDQKNFTIDINDPPVADNQQVVTNEDTPVNITLTGSDPNGDPITFSVVDQPSNGVLTGTAPNLTYSPNTNFNGADSFTFKVNDGDLDSNLATVSITVNAVNDPPVADDQNVQTNEDTPVNITLTASDVDQDSLTYNVVSGPSNGVLSGTAPNLTYTPNPDFNGADSFTFKANDGTDDSNVATVSITVNPVNDAPVADDQNVQTNEDTPVNITLTASDVDQDPLTYNVVSGPSNGVLTGTAPNLTYTPNNGFSGSDSFTFVANDGTVDSNVATVSITVNPVNDPPVADNQNVQTDEDTPVGITLTASDPDGDPLTFQVLTQPSNGTLTGTAPNLTYTPDPNYFGADSFTFKANDGVDDSNIATVSITVNPVNDAPVADDQDVSTNEDTPLNITLTASDVDQDSLTYNVVSGPANGTLSGTAPNLTYTPNTNFNGADSFTFKANDGVDDSNIATVSITVNAVNDAPVADDQNVQTDEDQAVAITLTASDVDLDSLTYNVVSGPANGTLSGTAPNLTYTPNTNFNGADSFTFKANDGVDDSNVATVSITVNAVNDAPVADDQNVSVLIDTPKSITMTGSDVDGDAITFNVETLPVNGVLSGSGATRTYTPNNGYVGNDSFTFTVNDGALDSNVATVNITVSGTANNPPVADDQNVATDEDVPVGITLTASDLDGDPLSYIIVTNPSNGVLTGSAPNVTYTPNPDFHGNDSFTFKASDGKDDSNIATVSITVNPINDAPVADNQNVSTDEDVAKAITLTGSDIDGDALTFTVVTGPSNGVLSGTAPNLVYTPNAQFSGSDSFTFNVNDGTVDSNVATVSITVNAVNDSPVADNQNVNVDEDSFVNIVLTASDEEGDSLTFSIVSQPANGVLSGSAPNVTYTPNPDFNGADSFTFKANDGNSDSNVATVNITVNPINDAPVADNQNVSTDEDVAKAITLTGSDVDGDALTFNVVSGPSNGALSGTAPNLVYTPNAQFSGSDSFTFHVNDGTVDSNVATVSITVNAVNDSPVADNQNVNVDEDSFVNIVLTASDEEGDSLTYSIVSQPANGVLSGTAPNVTYTPNPDFNGADSFTFKANDGNSDSNVATVNITVNPINDAPVADDQNVSTDEDVAKAITLTGSDIDGDALNFTVVTPPTNGALSGTAPNVTYTPNTNFNGSDSFTFRVNDGLVNSNVATVSITVNPVNDPPEADDQNVNVDEDSSLPITLTGTDVEGDSLTFSIGNFPSNGTLTGSAPNVTYTPEPDYYGSDLFTFIANDGTNNSTPGTVSITVNPINDAPVADNQNVRVAKNTPEVIILTASDPDGDSLSYAVDSGPFNGVLTGTPPNVTYTPNADYLGPDTFTFHANDGILDSNSATVSIMVEDATNNNPPVADNIPVVTRMDQAVNILLTGSDIDQDPLTFRVVLRPTAGTLSGIEPNMTYTPNNGFKGNDSFTFVADDGLEESAPGLVSIFVDGDNPTIDITSPTEGETVSGIVNVQATATDNYGVDKVEFFIDGTLVASQSNPPYSYSWDTSNVSEGNHTISATAHDLAGNTATIFRGVTVQSGGGNGNPPTIDIRTPQNLDFVRALVVFTVDVTGDDIAAVDFFIDNNLLDESMITRPNSPNKNGTYTVDWNTLLGFTDKQYEFRTKVTLQDSTWIEGKIDVIVDNTRPDGLFTNPNTTNGIPVVFGRQVFGMDVQDPQSSNGSLPNDIDRVTVDFGHISKTFFGGGKHVFEIDTIEKKPNGDPYFPDGSYIMEAFVYDKAQNFRIISIAFDINNTDPPVSQLGIIFGPPDFAVTDAESRIYFKFSGAIDVTSIIPDHTIKVDYLKNGNWFYDVPGQAVWKNADAELESTVYIPPNTQQVLVTLRDLRDNEGDIVSGQWPFLRAMAKADGGEVVTADGLVTINVPSNCAGDDYLFMTEKFDEDKFNQRIIEANDNYTATNQDVNVLAGPYDLHGIGRDGASHTDLDCAIQVTYVEPEVANQSEIGRVAGLEFLPDDDSVWRRPDNVNGASKLSSSDDQPSVRTVTGFFTQMMPFRITSFALPSSGIAGFINYPNPFSPFENGTQIQYSLAADMDVKIIIHDLFGNYVKKLEFPAGVNGGRAAQNIITWNGRNGENEPVANGGYIATVIAGDHKARRKLGVVK